MSATLVDPAFWRGRRVLLTGHTGFKGGWTALWLARMGAQVHGLALAPDSDPDLFTLADVGQDLTSHIGPLEDAAFVADVVARARPQVVLHMAARPLVRASVAEPVRTFATNVMGTAHLLDALRAAPDLQAVLVITTDKVYENDEAGRPFREADPLGGHDPYSASKAAAEIVTASFARTYFDAAGIPVATARGGNVIGGGDFSANRLVPDIFRALKSGVPLTLRNPQATRPWQHVLDCLEGYLAYAQALAKGRPVPRALNFGPLRDAQRPVAALADAMLAAFGAARAWQAASGPQPREMQTLVLDCAAAEQALAFRDHLVGGAAIHATADWYLALLRGDDMRAVTLRAIEERMSL